MWVINAKKSVIEIRTSNKYVPGMNIRIQKIVIRVALYNNYTKRFISAPESQTTLDRFYSTLKQVSTPFFLPTLIKAI